MWSFISMYIHLACFSGSLCCSMDQNFIPFFVAEQYSTVMDTLRSSTHLLMDTWDVSTIEQLQWVIVTSATGNVCVQVFESFFSVLWGYMPRSKITGSVGNSL